MNTSTPNAALPPPATIRMANGATSIAVGGLVVGAATLSGKVRSRNEDSVRLPSSDLPKVVLQKRGVLMVVTDGVGGRDAGDVAANVGAQGVYEAYYNAAGPAGSAAVAATLRASIQAGHERILRAIEAAAAAAKQDRLASPASPAEAAHSMASAIVAAVVLGRELFIVNVGDARGYVWREGVLRQLSTDHSWAAIQVRTGTLSIKAAREHTYGSLLLRSLGQPGATVTADVAQTDWRAGDRLLLCTDGLWGLVPDEQIARTMGDSHDPREIAEQLALLANEAGGHDNITVVVAAVVPQAPTQIIGRPAQLSRRMVALGLALLIVLAVGLGAGVILGSGRLQGTPTIPAATLAPTASLVPASPSSSPPLAMATAGVPTVTLAVEAGLSRTATAAPSVTPVVEPISEAVLAEAEVAPVPEIVSPVAATLAATPIAVSSITSSETMPITTTPALAPDIAFAPSQTISLQATATLAPMGIGMKFCRQIRRGVCAVATTAFNRRNMGIYAHWPEEALRGAPVIRIEWFVNGQLVQRQDCTLAQGRCAEQGVLPTQSRWNTMVAGQYDVRVQAGAQPLLSGTFSVQ